MSETIRDLVFDLSPPWMRTEISASINRALATVLDALGARTEEGVRLRFPGMGSPTALPYIGNDRQIERGPTQTDEGYAAQLQRAFDTWQNAGGARTILAQLRYFFAPGNGPPLRLVSDQLLVIGDSDVHKTIWHVIDGVTGVVTKSYRDNWNWSPTSSWRRGWAIIDGSGIWNPDYWDNVGQWGDGGVWGSDMSHDTARSLMSIFRRWKPVNVLGQIIITFDPSLFEATDVRPPNPDGSGEDDAWRATIPAAFMEEITA